MLSIGITGQSGFVGTYLLNTFSLSREQYTVIPFRDEYFESPAVMESFVSQCDVIIHLAAMNRHQDPNMIYETNIKLVEDLITALESTNSSPHILFSSSIQEELDNLYGASKKEGRRLFSEWAERNNAKFTGLLIPNVFGPFGAPFYNSVVATFCHQLTHGETPKIDVDGTLPLIFVGELVKEILKIIDLKNNGDQTVANISQHAVQYSTESKVSNILEILNGFKNNYFEWGRVPDLSTHFERDLFNTFVCFIDHSQYFPFMLKEHSDSRGSFVEIIRLLSGGQVSFSTTKPGITRGNHFHTRKAERFAVIKGKAKIELRRIGANKKQTFLLDGQSPSFVDMPIWHTHNITNIGNEDLYTIFWINEQFNPNDPDTYYEEV
jgi:UDP-2-acetamido-2,6-beta-L-arabino-hexul-4-ose reductase